MGDAEALRCLGWLYEFGNGVERDEEEAYRLYRLAASKGSRTAAEKLRRSPRRKF